MSPEYLNQLAELADPEQLWRLAWNDQLCLSTEQRAQLDTGIALRRHAADVERFERLRGKGKSLILTPLQRHGRHVGLIDTPENIARYVRL